MEQKEFVLKKKKNVRAITVSDCIYTLTVLTYRTAIYLDWLQANYIIQLVRKWVNDCV